MISDKDIVSSFEKLKQYCESENFNGWDPYDGLNSQWFHLFHLGKFAFFRLAWIQLFKRSPFNFRKITGVPKGLNPKGLGLFLTGYCNLYKVDPKAEYLEKIKFLADTLIGLKSPGYSGACWGYHFDWQSRAFFLPKYTPTVVVTSFAATALLDAYETTGNASYLDEALSSAKFITNDLNRTPKKEGFIFSYSPLDHTSVYNASLLGSRLLSRIYAYTKEDVIRETARASVLACVNAQEENGSWAYGALDIQNWKDSFHTGFNLVSLETYQKYCEDESFDLHLQKGLYYYLENFFLDDGTPKYYDTQIYPIDIHAPAQLIVTLYRLNIAKEKLNLARKVLHWTIRHMQDSCEGYFYYQLKKTKSSKIPYMRWSQAWMFYAMSFYFLEVDRAE